MNSKSIFNTIFLEDVKFYKFLKFNIIYKSFFNLIMLTNKNQHFKIIISYLIDKYQIIKKPNKKFLLFTKQLNI